MGGKYLAALMLGSLLAGCGAAPAEPAEGPSPDAESAAIPPVGKADSPFSACEVDAALLLASDPAKGVAELKAHGVHTLAAKNIVKTRAGVDGVSATDDDVVFRTLQDLDAVRWVGPAALTQLARVGSDRCPEGAYPSAEAIFSPQPKETSHLARAVQLIDAAQRSIDVAMYSFRDKPILEALGRARQRGVRVRFLYEPARDEAKDPAGTTSADIEALDIDVRFINKIMHHKFMIVDGPQDDPFHALGATLMTGSANWSGSAATRYDENSVVLRGAPELSMKFQKEFNLIWEISRDFVLGSAFAHELSRPIDAWMLLDDPEADVAFTSDNFKTFVSSYGPGFSVVSGKNTVADTLVELIEGAQSQILIASGHLRSRPVSEALLKKVAATPGLDVRVYLDGQEYVSAYTNAEEHKDLEECVQSAGSSVSKQQACYDKGFHWSYPVQAAGIPLRFKHYSYRWHYSYAPQMHHKYLIIDGQTLASGSYNLSDNAEHATMENMVIYRGSNYEKLVGSFVDNFEQMWATDAGGAGYAKLLDEVQNGTGPVPIVYDAMALSWQEVTTLKSAIRDACPDVDSAEYREKPEKHFVCYR